MIHGSKLQCGKQILCLGCSQEKEVMNNSDGCLWQEPPSMYPTNVWLKQHCARTGLQASKGLIPGLLQLVWRDWKEVTTSCAQLRQLVIATNSFLPV